MGAQQILAVLHQIPIAVFAFAQCIERSLALGDVDKNADRSSDFAIAIQEWRRIAENIARGPIVE
jgi:hypothetical protein